MAQAPRHRMFRSSVRHAEPTLELALLIPLHGSAGLYGPSCELCGQLAVEELNARGGILGREVRVAVVDGSGSPARVADEIGALVAAGLVDAVVGWHISAVRQAVAPRIAGRVPYIYTALYEGGERRHGVFLTGETPSRQLLPAMRWLHEQEAARRWAIVGDDYVWPRLTARAAHAYAGPCGGTIEAETFVPLGTSDFKSVLAGLERCSPDAVLMLLVGEDAVHFNRAFAQAGLQQSIRRLSTLMDENMLLASGAASTEGLFAAAAYFETLVTPESMDFGHRYARRFGADAPTLNSLGESCYEGILMLAALAHHAGSLDINRMCDVADSVTFAGPRGELRINDRHVHQRVYLAEAHRLEFAVVSQL